MISIAEALEKFNHLTEALREALDRFLEPFALVLPDRRFRKSFHLLFPALLAARSPHLSTAAVHTTGAFSQERPTRRPYWALAKRLYRLLSSPRFSSKEWLSCFYAQAVKQIRGLPPNRRVLVALDPLYLEKPYARKMEGICRVWKQTPPPSCEGGPPKRGRITWGYPSLFALAVNTPQPALLYHRLFSYRSADFESQPREWIDAMRHLSRLSLPQPICILADAEADDQKLWEEAASSRLEFICRATKERRIEVWRKGHWEPKELQEWAQSRPLRGRLVRSFTHAGRTVPIRVSLAWFHFRLPDGSWSGWAVVARTEVLSQEAPPKDMWLPPPYLVLVTNRPVRSQKDAQRLYNDWAQRGQIDQFYRFLQEDGLDAEAILLRQMERFRRLLLVVVLAAFFVLQLEQWWSPVLIRWIRSLASGLVGMKMDRGGKYLLLRGIQRLLDGRALLEYICVRPPPIHLLLRHH